MVFKKFTKTLLIIFLFVSDIRSKVPHYDVAIVGLLNFRCSISRLPIVWIDCLHQKMKVNYLNSRRDNANLEDVSIPIKKIISSSQQNCTADVSIFFDLLWDARINYDVTNSIPESSIKIAYSMLESSTIPGEWVNKLNSKFDAVVVPDSFLVPVYKSAGVKIPIFVLPIGLYLKEFFNNKPKKSNSQHRFTFGTSAVLVERKNHELLIESFTNEFKKDPKFKLVIHGRFEEKDYLKKLQRQVTALNNPNITIMLQKLSQKNYINFLSKIDCYVLLSKGEGFSVSPYEALALGIPCILTDNTAHSTICNSGFAKSVKSNILQKAYYPPFKKFCGFQTTCSIADAQKALRDVYQNYLTYQKKANEARDWVNRNSIEKLKPLYISLVKPKKVTLGSKNIIYVNEIVTNDRKLFNKYKKLIHNSN